MMPLNLGTFATMKLMASTFLKDHRDDFPPEYLRWIEIGEKMTLNDFDRDQWVRSEVYDAVQSVFAKYDLLITPTVAGMPVMNRDDGNTVGPERDQWRGGRPPYRLVPDLSVQLHRSPCGINSGRTSREFAGRNADRGSPLC